MAYRFSLRMLGTSVGSLVAVSFAFCAACGGSSFNASSGDAGTGAGGTGADGGSTSVAGTSDGGTNTAGTSDGGTNTGGTSTGGTGSAGKGTGGGSHKGGSGSGGSSAGGTSSGGSNTGGTGTGGTTSGGTSAGGTNGAGTGGTSTGGTGGAPPDCATMKTEYAALVEKARVCDAGSTDECSPSSTLPPIGCGCPVLVNAKSTYTDLARKKYKAMQDANCLTGQVCGIACLAVTSASCSPSSSASTSYVCVGSSGVIN